MIIPLPKLTLLVLTVALPALLTACAGRRVSTSVADQSFVPGSAPQAVTSTPPEATAIPPLSAGAVPPQVEASKPAGAQAETRITEPPMVAVAPSTPVTPSVHPADRGSLADVYFDFDQFLIRPEAGPVLKADAQMLKADIGHQVLIEGHCDERGTLAYNLVLGERRARAVRQYLEDLGVPASAMQITSYGKERPFCRDHSEGCWQSNRRAHFATK